MQILALILNICIELGVPIEVSTRSKSWVVGWTVNLILNQRVVGYLHSFSATVVPMGVFCQANCYVVHRVHSFVRQMIGLLSL